MKPPPKSDLRNKLAVAEWTLMRAFHCSAILVCACLLSAMPGCSRDPNVRKQKYFDSGNRYFEKGQFPEAAIEFSNAADIDLEYGAAHFKLGESYLKMQRFPEAYRELERAVELDPGNTKAMLDIGLIYIAARSYKQIEPIAKRMLDSDPKNPDAHLLLSELN